MFKKSLILGFILLLSPLVASAGVILKAPSSLGLSSGLIGHWTFDGNNISGTNALDSSGLGNTGTITGAGKAIGKLGQALSFDGSSNQVVASIGGAVPQSITISAWIYPTAGGVVMSECDVTSCASWHESQMEVMSTGEIKVGYWIGSLYSLSLGTYSLNNWHHVVMTFNNTNNQIVGYVDGILKNSNTADKLYPGTLAYSIGKSDSTSHGDGTYFNGKIDDARLYNRVLSANEVSRLYNMGASNKVNTPTTSLTSGLVGYWTMDGSKISGTSALDSSVSNKTGIITGATKTIGKLGQAMNFDGNSDYVSVSNATTVVSPYSVSMWFYPRQLGPARGLIAFTTAGSIYTFLDSTRIQIASASAGSFRTWCNKVFTASDLNKWWHLTYVVNSTTDASLWKCYLNSVSVGVADSDNSGTFGQPTTNWTLGAYYNNSYWFDGKLDDVRVYNRALSTDEITQLYNMGEATKINKTPTSVSSGLVGHWTMDGSDTYWSSATAGTVKDKSGNNNTGTLTNMSRSSSPTIGKLGQAFKFDGGDDTINAGTASSLDDIELQGGGGMSVAFWIKPGSSTTKTIIGKGNASNGTGFWSIFKSSATNPPRISFTKEGATDSNVGYNSALTIGQWQHIIITWNGSMTFSTGVNMYKNGTLISQNVVTNGATANSDVSGNLHIGSSNGLVDFLDGDLDDVRIYNKVLSLDEIQTIYNAGR